MNLEDGCVEKGESEGLGKSHRRVWGAEEGAMPVLSSDPPEWTGGCQTPSDLLRLCFSGRSK
jgi:hypothetical protein